MIAALQAQLIFPTHAVGAGAPLPRGAMALMVPTPDGAMMHGVHVPPSRAAAEGEPRTLILGFGGNAWNGGDVAGLLHHLYPTAEVVVFHYRGYRPSTGTPSADALIADAPLVHDAAVERVKPARIVGVGFSIGSAVAASLADRRPLDGLILVTPFDSLRAAASDLYPWLPVATFLAHEFDTASFVRGSRVPVAIIAGADDALIRPARTDALRRVVPNLAFDRTIAGAGHNDLYARPEFGDAMHEAMRAL